jgi:hypothetical protein
VRDVPVVKNPWINFMLQGMLTEFGGLTVAAEDPP